MGVFTRIDILFTKRSVQKREISFWFVSEQSIPQILLMRTCLSIRNKEHLRRKWFVDSISFPQRQVSSRQSLKLCFNLWPRKWLKPRKLYGPFFLIGAQLFQDSRLCYFKISALKERSLYFILSPQKYY